MKLKDKTIGIFIGPGFEDLEFWVPHMRMQEEGAMVRVIGSKAGESFFSKHGCLTASAEVAAKDQKAGDYDALIVPGGWCPDKIRRDPAIQSLVKDVYDAGNIVGMICHAGLVGISAGIVGGHKATGSEGIKDDLINAGAEWIDESAFRDRNLVWGRVVADIPNFCRELVAAIGVG